MSKAAALQSALYDLESASIFGEDITPTIRMMLVDRVDLSSLSHEKLEPNRTTQLLHDGTPHITGPQGGTVTTKHYLTGHGSATSGATALTSLATLLLNVFGAAAASAASGTTFTGGTATAPTTTASGTFIAGSLCRAGVKGDGRADGQWAAISSHAATTLNLLTGLPAAPNNGDVLHSAETINVLELPASLGAIRGITWRFQTANLQYDCHGCYAQSARFTVPVNGGLPFVEITWGVAWWEPVAGTFPTATSGELFQPGPSGPGGSFFLNAVGTATRAVRTITSFSINVNLNTKPIMAPGGITNYQAIVGARRAKPDITVEWEEESPAASTTPQSDTDWDTQYHALLSCCVAPGSALAFYFPRLCPMGPKPVQGVTDDLNRQPRRYAAYSGNTQTTDLTASAMRIGLA